MFLFFIFNVKLEFIVLVVVIFFIKMIFLILGFKKIFKMLRMFLFFDERLFLGLIIGFDLFGVLYINFFFL